LRDERVEITATNVEESKEKLGSTWMIGHTAWWRILREKKYVLVLGISFEVWYSKTFLAANCT